MENILKSGEIYSKRFFVFIIIMFLIIMGFIFFTSSHQLVIKNTGFDVKELSVEQLSEQSSQINVVNYDSLSLDKGYVCERGLNYDTYCFNGTSTRKAVIDAGKKNYYNGSEWKAINLDIQNLNGEWEYGVEGFYKSFFNERIEGFPVKYEYDGEYVLFKPLYIGYFNRDEIEIISSDVSDALGSVYRNEFVYNKIFVDSINLSYTYGRENIKEKLILNDKSFIDFNKEYFVFRQAANVSSNLIIKIDGEIIKKDEKIETGDEIEFWKDGRKLFFIPKAEAWDDNIHIYFNRSLTYTGDLLYIDAYVPMDFIENAETPIVIDDTIILGDADAEIKFDGFVNYIDDQIGGSFTFLSCNESSVSNLGLLMYVSAWSEEDQQATTTYNIPYIEFNVSAINATSLISVDRVELNLSTFSSNTQGKKVQVYRPKYLRSQGYLCNQTFAETIASNGTYLTDNNLYNVTGNHTEYIFDEAANDLRDLRKAGGEMFSVSLSLGQPSATGTWSANFTPSESGSNPQLIVTYTPYTSKMVEYITSSGRGYVREVDEGAGNEYTCTSGDMYVGSTRMTGFDGAVRSYLDFNINEIPATAQNITVLLELYLTTTGTSVHAVDVNKLNNSASSYACNAAFWNNLSAGNISSGTKYVRYNSRFGKNAINNWVNISLGPQAGANLLTAKSEGKNFSIGIKSNTEIGSDDYLKFNSSARLIVLYQSNCDPPPSGDWECNVTCIQENKELTAAGNLYVYDSCILDLKGTTNVTFTSLSKFIYVYPGGQIRIYDSAGFNKKTN